MFNSLLLLTLGAFLVGFAIGNIVSRKAFRAMPLGLAIAYRAAAAFISVVATVFAAGVALVVSAVIIMFVEYPLGLSEDVMAYGTCALVTVASFLTALLVTRSYYTTALRKPNERRGP